MAGLVGQTGFFPGDRRLRELDLLGDELPGTSNNKNFAI